jgi:Novel STAND NTPase 1/TIR domain/WD domain, G-beta repeat
MARIFISHSSRDNDAADRMKAWLASQGFENAFLDKDKTTGIPPGADWEKTLYREVEQSQAVIIIQTPDWLASKWCFAEFTQARALGKAIFPVIETPTGGTLISPDIQTLNLLGDREGGLERLSRELVRIALDAQGGITWDARRPPFPGLLAFEEEDAAVYFGRDDEIRRLIERLEARRAQGGAKLIALLGSSGSGKSSLLRAGVIPRLKRAGRNWIVVQTMRPRLHPVDALAVALATACGSGADWRKLKDDLVRPDPTPGLDGLANDLRVKAGAGEAQVLIPIDQAEELFGIADPDEALRFLEILSQALSENLPFMAVMALRSDFLGRLQSAKVLTSRFEEFSLGPMPLARVRQIIEGPARVAGLTVGDAFVQQAASDAETDDALPLLAFALRELLDRSSNKSLTLEGYKALGDEIAGLTPLENAVRKAADDVLATAKPADDELMALREAFVPALVRVNDQGEYVRRPALWAELPPKAQPLLERLANARLLIVRQDRDARVAEVAHEALLRKWPLLRTWLDSARVFLIGKQQLEQDLRDWDDAADKDKAGTLLTGLKLNRARGWLIEQSTQLTAEERAFIRASIEHADEEERRKEQLRRDAIANESRALTALSQAARLRGHYTDAVKLALAAWPRSAGDERPMLSRTIAVLGQALAGPLEVSPPLRHDGQVHSASFSHDGARVVTACQDNTARVWDAATGAPIGRPLPHGNWVLSASFSREGSLVVTASKTRLRGFGIR